MPKRRKRKVHHLSCPFRPRKFAGPQGLASHMAWHKRRGELDQATHKVADIVKTGERSLVVVFDLVKEELIIKKA